MTPQDAKIAIRQAQSREGVYDTLEKLGVSVCSHYSLRHRIKEFRAAFRHDVCEVIQVALMRLDDIENREV